VRGRSNSRRRKWAKRASACASRFSDERPSGTSGRTSRPIYGGIQAVSGLSSISRMAQPVVRFRPARCGNRQVVFGTGASSRSTIGGRDTAEEAICSNMASKWLRDSGSDGVRIRQGRGRPQPATRARCLLVGAEAVRSSDPSGHDSARACLEGSQPSTRTSSVGFCVSGLSAVAEYLSVWARRSMKSTAARPRIARGASQRRGQFGDLAPGPITAWARRVHRQI